MPDNDYRRFLRDRVDGLEQRVSGGPFVLEDGTPVGNHEGYPFYTIGQRHGLGLALGEGEVPEAEPLGPVHIRGRHEPVTLYRLV